MCRIEGQRTLVLRAHRLVRAQSLELDASLTDMSHISACVGTTVASETRPRYSFSLAELRRRSAARQRARLLWRRMLAGRTDFASLEVVSRGLAGRASGTASSRVDVPVSGLAIERASSTLCACMFGVAARRVNERMTRRALA